ARDAAPDRAGDGGPHHRLADRERPLPVAERPPQGRRHRPEDPRRVAGPRHTVRRAIARTGLLLPALLAEALAAALTLAPALWLLVTAASAVAVGAVLLAAAARPGLRRGPALRLLVATAG